MLTTGRLLRVILCGVVGALIGLGIGLVAASSGAYFGVSVPWAFVAAAALVGLGGGAGYEWARRGGAIVWGAATLVFSLIWGGLFLLSVKAGMGAPPLVAALPLGVVGLGLLVWALLAGRATVLAQAVRPVFPGVVEAPLGALSGAAFGLGYGLLFRLIYPWSLCGPLEHCPPPHYQPWYGLTTMLPAATIVGLAFGVILAFALAVGARLRPLEPTRG